MQLVRFFHSNVCWFSFPSLSSHSFAHSRFSHSVVRVSVKFRNFKITSTDFISFCASAHSIWDFYFWLTYSSRSSWSLFILARIVCRNIFLGVYSLW